MMMSQLLQEKVKDEILVDLIINEGREELLSVIYNRYYKKVYYGCLKIVKDVELAKDLSQDVLLKVFAKLSQYKGSSTFNMWVRAITYNYCIDYIRKSKRLYVESLEEEILGGSISYEEGGVKEKILFEERALQLKALIQELKEKDQKVIKMRYYEGLSIKEISEAIGSGVSATKMRLKRAKTRLIERADDLELIAA